MGMTGISKSQVSRLCGEIDERVNAFLDRPIEGDWPYIWIDATYVKVRQAGRIVSVAVIIAVGVNTDGIREVLGVAVGPSEAEPFWTDFLRSLTRRGLRGVKLVISDAHLGLKAAIAKVFKATWQRCRVHFIRNALAYAGKGQRQMVLALINTVFAQESAEAARAQWDIVSDQLRAKFPKLAVMLNDAQFDVLAFMDFPKGIGRRSRQPIRLSESTPRSSGVPTSSASSRTIRRSSDSSERSCSSRTTSGNCNVATCNSKDYRSSAKTNSIGSPQSSTAGPQLRQSRSYTTSRDTIVSFSGIAIWHVRDGRLAECWVERSAYEFYNEIIAKQGTKLYRSKS
jgi:hypothetical protein